MLPHNCLEYEFNRCPILTYFTFNCHLKIKAMWFCCISIDYFTFIDTIYGKISLTLNVSTYCPARSLRLAASAGWFVCEGSERSRCSPACCLLGGHSRSTSLRSEPGTLVDPAVASGNLKKTKKKEPEMSVCEMLVWFVMSCLGACLSISSLLLCLSAVVVLVVKCPWMCADVCRCKWLTVIHPEDDRRGQPCRGPALQHQGDPHLHHDGLISLLWPQGGPCESHYIKQRYCRLLIAWWWYWSNSFLSAKAMRLSMPWESEPWRSC